jgi:hypothetical protein
LDEVADAFTQLGHRHVGDGQRAMRPPSVKAEGIELIDDTLLKTLAEHIPARFLATLLDDVLPAREKVMSDCAPNLISIEAVGPAEPTDCPTAPRLFLDQLEPVLGGRAVPVVTRLAATRRLPVWIGEAKTPGALTDSPHLAPELESQLGQDAGRRRLVIAIA